MKKINKIIAVLIVISLLSSFAVYASAENNIGTMRLSFTDVDGNSIDSAAAGDMIDVYISINTAGRYVKVLQSDIMYDYNIVRQVRKDSTAYQNPTRNVFESLGDIADDATEIEDESDPIIIASAAKHDDFMDRFGYYALSGAGDFNVAVHSDDFYPDAWTDTQKAQYKLVRVGYKTTGATCHLGIYSAENEYTDLARIRFIADVDIEKLDSSIIGWCADSANEMLTTESNEPLSVYMSGVVAMQMAFEVAEAAVVESPVYWVKNQIQWNNKEAKSVNLGVVAGFDVKDIAIDFGDDNIADNVTAVGAKFYIDGVLQDDLTTTRVYKAKGGDAYYFRIVLGNISTTTQNTYKVVPYVVYDGTPVDGPEVEIKPADVARYVKVLP